MLSAGPAYPGRFGAIILAGGMSRRMGSAKALLDIDGLPLICRLIQTISKLNQIERIDVVTGHDAPRLEAAVMPHFSSRVSFVHNRAYETGGMLSSAKAGVQAVSDAWDGFFLCLLDQPVILRSTLQTMIQAWLRSRPALVVPSHACKNGHPLLIASRCTGAIMSLPADATLRKFVTEYRAETSIVEVNDPGVGTDVDTPDDYQRVLQIWRTSLLHSSDAGEDRFASHADD